MGGAGVSEPGCLFIFIPANASKGLYTRTVPASTLVSEALPLFATELESLLREQGESELAAQIENPRIVDRCRCGDDFCATFYTESKPEGAYGPDHRNVEVTPKDGMIILDLVDGRIAGVEVLFRDEVRNQLQSILP